MLNQIIYFLCTYIFYVTDPNPKDSLQHIFLNNNLFDIHVLIYQLSTLY